MTDVIEGADVSGAAGAAAGGAAGAKGSDPQSVTAQKVLVLDFGAQYGQLIARRVRDLGVYSEIAPCDEDAQTIAAQKPAAIILSGGPASVYEENAPKIDPNVLQLGIPILGFCYGHQTIAVELGGRVAHTEAGEYGPATLEVGLETSRLFANTNSKQTVWMSHRDAVVDVPAGFSVSASTAICPVAAMECAELGIYATQFHPEVGHTEFGRQILENFLFGICGLEKTWKMADVAAQKVAEIKAQVGADRVILGLSGGVDSSVVAALAAKAIGKA